MLHILSSIFLHALMIFTNILKNLKQFFDYLCYTCIYKISNICIFLMIYLYFETNEKGRTLKS